jgi:hypothetical protein
VCISSLRHTWQICWKWCILTWTGPSSICGREDLDNNAF